MTPMLLSWTDNEAKFLEMPLYQLSTKGRMVVKYNSGYGISICPKPLDSIMQHKCCGGSTSVSACFLLTSLAVRFEMANDFA
jgi:hypothetical protein